MIEERYIHDPVPKNVTKFPIQQTYITTDAERTANNGWKFKCPEVWSSARSGKKSIAIRSIKWRSHKSHLAFMLSIGKVVSSAFNADVDLKFSMAISATASTHTIIDTIKSVFDQQLQYRFGAYLNTLDEMDDVTERVQKFDLHIRYDDNTLTFEVTSRPGTAAGTYQLYLMTKRVANEDIIDNSFQDIFNQPYINGVAILSTNSKLEFKNVWDRETLNFHASFIPFDNYQYLGALGDEWNTPIVYQDPNTSPLFNVWVTHDLKTPLKILHENFIIRFTFIISTESQYSS